MILFPEQFNTKQSTGHISSNEFFTFGVEAEIKSSQYLKQIRCLGFSQHTPPVLPDLSQ